MPITTIYYDTGFLTGLKGFVAAIIGGLVSYPLTAVAAILVGCVEAFSSFYASNYKEVDRLHAVAAGADPAFAGSSRRRGRARLMAALAGPCLCAGDGALFRSCRDMPPFWLVLLDNIGLAALVAIGLVILTGVGGLTSFGQAAFCGFGAYTTAVLTTQYGWSPWLTLPASLLVAGGAAVLLGLVTVRLSGHYLPLGTIAWGISLYYIFGKVELLGRNDGISGIPPLSIGAVRFADPRAIYFIIWLAVIVAAVLTMNLLDSRTGRAIRALRRGHVAAEAFGVPTARMKLLVFIHAAVLAGLSGWLYAHFQAFVNPTPFGLNAGIEYLFIAVVGGAGYVWGAVLGAGVVTILKDILQGRAAGRCSRSTRSSRPSCSVRCWCCCCRWRRAGCGRA